MYKLFSQRKREEKEGISDIYQYDNFCEGFRNQFVHIVRDIFNAEYGNEYHHIGPECVSLWHITCQRFAREKGLKYINDDYGHINNRDAFIYFVEQCSDEDFLDLLDFVFVKIIKSTYMKNIVCREKVKQAIEELNYRFKQHSLGYEFINGELIIKTNEHIHREIIKPALHLLNNKIFKGAEQEYFQAFEHYKKGQNKDAILNAIKAFESVLKSICQEMQYPYDRERDTAKQLLQHLTDNGFYPKYLESHLNGIRSTLESGAPTLRNKNAGHGQGQEVVDVSDEYVEYALNLVATNIVLLVKILNVKKRM